MSSVTFILGGAQSDFARHLAREGAGLGELAGELVDAALADAALEAGDVQTIHVGNAFGELFAGQGHLGALPATVRPALWGVPAARHEGACASGSLAVLAAAAELEAGRYDCALVLGVEQERNVGGQVAAQHLAAAAWVGHEGELDAAKYLWPAAFAKIGEVYAERYGLDRAHLAALAQLAFGNAKGNPHAQTRGWTIDAGTLAEDDATNPRVAGDRFPLRRSDCAQVTDGGAALVLASPRFAEGWAARRGVDLARVPRLLGWGHRGAGLTLASKLERAQRDPDGLLFPLLAAAMTDARRRAGDAPVAGYEVHDCFTPTMYLAIEHLGITAPGRAWEAIEDGRLARTGRVPINPSGGLIGGGHPVGATGVRMVLDAARQTSDRAGACQVPGARRFGTLNLGGSTATVVAFVVGV